MKEINPPKSESLLILPLLQQLSNPELASQHNWVLLTPWPPCFLSHWATKHNQFPGVSRTDRQIMARSSSNKGKDVHQLVLSPHPKM